MTVTVTPEQFGHLQYDARTIGRVVDEFLERFGMGGRDVLVEIDETSPLVRLTVTPGDPIVVSAHSGAFEDSRRPRNLSEVAVAINAGRALLRLHDRETTFAGAPDDADLSLPQMAAWDTYAVGRLGRAGYPVHEQRWRYNFRNRHGFTDHADRVFDRLWAADTLTWDELSSLSDDAAGAKEPA